MTETKSPMRWKIIESVPDKNKIILLGVKESLDGDFSTRDDALAAIRYAHSAMASKQHEPSYQDLVDHIRWTQNLWRHGIEIMRKNNLVIASDTPMEKLAFTFYSDLCEIDLRALHLFGEGPGDENYKDQSAIQAREIVPYPRPYEEAMKQAAEKQGFERALKWIYNSCECIPYDPESRDFDKGFHQAMTLVRGWINQKLPSINSIPKTEKAGE